MTVMRNDNRWDRSNVVYRPPRVLYDKKCSDPVAAGMTHIDDGLAALPRDLIAERITPDAACDLADLYNYLSLAGELAGYEVAERFYEVGSPAGLAEFAAYAAELRF